MSNNKNGHAVSLFKQKKELEIINVHMVEEEEKNFNDYLDEDLTGVMVEPQPMILSAINNHVNIFYIYLDNMDILFLLIIRYKIVF